MPKLDAARVRALIAKIEAERPPATDFRACHAFIATLVADEGATHRHAGGAEHLKIAGVTGQSTAGGSLLVDAWLRRARVALERADA